MNQEKQIIDKLVQQILVVVFVFIIICSGKGTKVSLHIPQDLLDVCNLNLNNIFNLLLLLMVCFSCL